MRVLFTSSEVASLAKTGGLADVALALPKALSDIGIDVAVAMPKYRAVTGKADMSEVARFSVSIAGKDRLCIAYKGRLPDSEVPIYFIGHDDYFDRPELYGEGSEYEDALERFAFFSRASLELCKILQWVPEVIHLNDWHTSLIPAYLRDHVVPELSQSKTLLTIHNLGYQGVSPWSKASATGLSDEALVPYRQQDRINLLKGGILGADLINAVSPTYATEILSDGAGLEQELRLRRDCLHGVLNGVDTSVWNPQSDPHLWATFDNVDLAGKAVNKRHLQQELGLQVDPSVPVLAVISRLAAQKGFDIIMEAFDRLMALDVQFVLLGTGDRQYEEYFRSAQTRYPGKVASMITFSEEWAHRIEASADVFLMPSHYEPCGLNQLYSLQYGTAPLVRATGGLKDTVFELDMQQDTGNGFLFEECNGTAFLVAVERAVSVFREHPEAWRRMMRRGMSEDLSWASSATAYQKLYMRLLG
jgi:starch synthase